MKELLEGRRLGFALRPVLGAVALGLALAALLADLAGWFAWGARDTNAFVWAGYWLVCGAIILTLLGLLTAIAELRDVPDEERALARVDLVVAALAVVTLGLSAGLRSVDLGAAGATPAALLLAVLGSLALLVGTFFAGNLYAPREWEEIVEELPRERRPRRHAAGR